MDRERLGPEVCLEHLAPDVCRGLVAIGGDGVVVVAGGYEHRFPVVRAMAACRVLGLSTQGYYTWLEESSS